MKLMTREQAIETMEKAKESAKDLIELAGPASRLEVVIVMRVRYGEESAEHYLREVTHCDGCVVEMLEGAQQMFMELKKDPELPVMGAPVKRFVC